MQRSIARYPVEAPLGLRLTPEVQQALGKRRAADIYDYCLYDTLRFKPATATGTNTLRFFTTGVGQQANVANAASENYIKDFIDTNLQGGNNLPRDQFLIVRSIQFEVNITDATDTTYPTTGVGTELPTDPTAAAAVAGGNLINALLHQAYMQFWVGEKPYEEGPIIQFPSEFGISGFSGFGVSTNFEGVMNNGFGYPRLLFVERLIPELTNFRVDLRFAQALTITRQLVIQCLLRGILLRAVQ
jgi:hypothetical protein